MRTDADTGAMVPVTQSSDLAMPDARRLEALMERAHHGDKKAMTALQPLLDAAPNWELDVDGPAAAARHLLLQTTLGNDLVLRGAWDRRAQTLERELAGTTPTPLERTLCERIACCWLDVQLADLMFAARCREGMTFAAGEYYQRRQDRAQARYLAAVQALARVRRLLQAPVVAQVNIAQPGAQQVNLAAAAPATHSPLPAPFTSVANEAS